jgi:hypothetical protein
MTEVNSTWELTEAHIYVVVIYNKDRLCSLLDKNRHKKLVFQTSRLSVRNDVWRILQDKHGKDEKSTGVLCLDVYVVRQS